RLHVRELLEPPALDLAARGVQRVLRHDGIRVPRLLEQLLLPPATPRLRLVPRLPPLERPVARELLERGAEAREVEVDAGDPGFLELLHPRAHRPRDARLDVLPVLRRLVRRDDRPRPAH